MVKYFFVALLVFVVSAIWLFVAISKGNATKNWDEVPAQIGSSNVDRNLARRGRGRLGRIRSSTVHTDVKYNIGGIEYEATVDDFIVAGGKTTVFVNPEDPTDVVGHQGPNVQHYGRPLIVTIGSGLFLIVLGLIAFSPKED